jgi:predicted Rossmann-fold nucleotide-binding protein
VASGTVNEHQKPCFIVDYKGFYMGLKVQIEYMRQLQFLPQEEQYAPIFVDTMDELINKLSELK